MRFEIEYFVLDNGTCPIREFIDSLDAVMKARCLAKVRLLSELGNELRFPHSRHLEGGIFELRIQSGSNISRILYFFFSGRKIVLKNGFIKKSQKTPAGEKEKAERYRILYERRQQCGNTHLRNISKKA